MLVAVHKIWVCLLRQRKCRQMVARSGNFWHLYERALFFFSLTVSRKSRRWSEITGKDVTAASRGGRGEGVGGGEGQIASERAELKVSRRKEESALRGGGGAERFEHLPGNRMAAVLERSGDFLFVSSSQEVGGPRRTSGLTDCESVCQSQSLDIVCLV